MSITPKCLAQAQFAGVSAGTIYTAPGATTTIIDQFTATNTDSTARTITVYLVANGGSAGAANIITSILSIAGNATLPLPEIKNQILNTGDFISVQASIASKVIVRASGREVA